MLTDRERRLAYKANLKAHLSQLSHLAGRNVAEEELLPLDQTELIRSQISQFLKTAPQQKFVIDFDERVSKKFVEFVNRLQLANPSPVYVWIAETSTCGLFEIKSISEFNFSFEYSVFPQGVISLTTADLRDRMMLDFFEDNDGQRIIEIELNGVNWPYLSVPSSPVGCGEA